MAGPGEGTDNGWNDDLWGGRLAHGRWLGLLTVLTAVTALVYPAAVIVFAQPTTRHVWVAIGLMAVAFLLTAKQWVRRDFVAVVLLSVFLMLDLLIGVGKQTQLGTPRLALPELQDTALARGPALQKTLAALKPAEPVEPAQTTLLSRAIIDVVRLCQYAQGRHPAGNWRPTPLPSAAQSAAGCTQPPAHDLDLSGGHDLELAVAKANRDVAAASDALEQTHQLPAADRALAAAKAATTSSHDFTLIDNGAAAVADSVWGSDTPLTTLTLEGWLVVAVTALLAFRWLLIVNGWNGWGPVEVHADSEAANGTTDADDTRRRNTLRMYLIQNVREPAAVPGTSAVLQVSDLASAAMFGGGAWIKGLATFVTWALAPPTGYLIRFSFQEHDPQTPAAPGADGAKSFEVTVRVATRGRSQLLDTKTLTGDSEDAALRTAAYWAAGWIISSANFVPGWAKWNADAGEHLADVEAARPGGQTSATAMDDELLAIEKARAADRSSGLILLRLGEAFQARDRLLDALEAYLIAMNGYPEYPVARYRAATVFSAIAHVPDTWQEAVAKQDGLTDRILDLTEATPGHKLVLKNAGAPPADTVTALCQVAQSLFTEAAQSYQRSAILWLGFNRSQRRFWRQLFGPAKQVREIYLTARSLAREINPAAPHASPRKMKAWEHRTKRRPPAPTEPQPTDAAQPQAPDPTPSDPAASDPAPPKAPAWAGAVYNLACAMSMHSLHLTGDDASAARVAAMEALEEAPTRHAGDELKAEWIDRDPDLGPIRQDRLLNARYQRLLAILDPKRQVSVTSRRDEELTSHWP